MNYLINSTFFYVLLPIYIAVALLLFFFNLPDDYLQGIFSFVILITVPVFLFKLFIPFKYRMQDYYKIIIEHKEHRFIALSLCTLIVCCAPLDIYINGFKLLRPETYAEFNGIGRYVRHITILCWIFVPVSFIFLRSSIMKVFFISFALLFPILIIDRNRLFISCWSLLFCLMMQYSLTESKRDKTRYRTWLFLIIFICGLVFSAVGLFRSGSAFIVPSSGTAFIEGSLPLSEAFTRLPALLQQLILYVTTPLFNFTTIYVQDYINPEFLQSQLSPFHRDSFNVYPYAPILSLRYNVGTEFFPFLLYGGLQLVFWAFIGMLISFYLAIKLFKKYSNIFTLLIFIKISYNMLFMGFAPQFYILLNLMFIVIMIFLWFFSTLCRVALCNQGVKEYSF